MKELWAKIREALVSALPITAIVYLIALLPGFSFNRWEMISVTVGAVLLVLANQVSSVLNGKLLIYVVGFGVVNAGYAEDAMEVAREQGARGGTIISGRGVAREKEAAFFGITIHAEKEVLMMVVEKDIRDQVLHALYKQMGMQKKAQGIVFSLPVCDVAGLVKIPEKTEEA